MPCPVSKWAFEGGPCLMPDLFRAFSLSTFSCIDVSRGDCSSCKIESNPPSSYRIQKLAAQCGSAFDGSSACLLSLRPQHSQTPWTRNGALAAPIGLLAWAVSPRRFSSTRLLFFSSELHSAWVQSSAFDIINYLQ
eukprot:695895-Amphidinium_carterae.1